MIECTVCAALQTMSEGGSPDVVCRLGCRGPFRSEPSCHDGPELTLCDVSVILSPFLIVYSLSLNLNLRVSVPVS